MNDDTFRGENFLNGSSVNGNGIAGLGTLGLPESIPQSSQNISPLNFSLNGPNMASYENKMNEGGTGVFSGNNTFQTSSHFANGTNDNTTLAASGQQMLPQQIHQNKNLEEQLQRSQEQLQMQEDQLSTFRNKSVLQKLKGIVDKFWLKHSLCEIHKNLSEAQAQLHSQNA